MRKATIRIVALAALAVALLSPPASAADASFGPLKGRWLRPDGGYVLDIREIRADGGMEVAYLNPRPIHVGFAKASHEGAKLKVFVELQAPNYPGSTYTLTYDPKRDELQGVYFQAVQKQNFDVVFVRAK
jgi:uncharacterized protein (DUF2147 family)